MALKLFGISCSTLWRSWIEKFHQPFDTLSTMMLASIDLPIKEGILELVKELWQALAALPPIVKRVISGACRGL